MGGTTDITVSETLKVATPDKFSGNRRDLETFLLQLEIYFTFNESKFRRDADKTVWTASYLRGEAAGWIQPYLKDYFAKGTESQMGPTRIIFGSFDGFKREIRRVFGNLNDVREAESKIYNLRQTGSAVKYAVEFRRYIATTGWDMTASMSHYKRGLKPEVKLDLDRSFTSNDLNELIEDSIKIDDMLYEYQRERRTPRAQGSQKYRKIEGRRRQGRYEDRGDPMELDGTERRKSGGLSAEEKKRRRDNKLCYSCGKEGHMSKDCSQKKSYTGKKGRKPWEKKKTPREAGVMEDNTRNERIIEVGVLEPEPMFTKEQLGGDEFELRRLGFYEEQSEEEEMIPLNTETTEEHAALSWTACYDEDCRIHLSDKEATGWFPRPPKQKKQPREAGSLERDLPQLNEEQLEEMGISTQLVREQYSDDEEPVRSEDSEDEQIPQEISPTLEALEQLFDSSGYDQRLEEARLRVIEELRGPHENEKWYLVGFTNGIRRWRHWDEEKEDFVERYRTHEHPTLLAPHVVAYRDQHRIVFIEHTDEYDAKRYIADLGSVTEEDGWDCNLENLRVGSTWEIILQEGTRRVWRKVRFWDSLQLHHEYFQDHQTGSWELATATPYKLIYQDERRREWLDCLHDVFTVEPLILELNGTAGIGHLRVNITLGGLTTKALIDSGAMGIFMDPDFARENQIPTKQKRIPYQLTLLGGKEAGIDGWVRKQTCAIELIMQDGHAELAVFDLVPLGRHTVVLGTPWIKKHNPSIDWVDESLTFDRCNCKTQ